FPVAGAGVIIFPVIGLVGRIVTKWILIGFMAIRICGRPFPNGKANRFSVGLGAIENLRTCFSEVFLVQAVDEGIPFGTYTRRWFLRKEPWHHDAVNTVNNRRPVIFF